MLFVCDVAYNSNEFHTNVNVSLLNKIGYGDPIFAVGLNIYLSSRIFIVLERDVELTII